jgi:FHA domain/Double zinc ribbon
MIICARCGASNKPEADACRMCAGPLAPSDGTPTAARRGVDPSVTTLVMPNAKAQEGALDIAGVVLCPSCHAVNREGWTFCSQCGKTMEATLKQPAPSRDRTTGEAITDRQMSYTGSELAEPVANTLPLASSSAHNRPHLRLLMEEGDTGFTYQLKDETAIGRAEGDITFPHDGFVSTHHARIIRRGPDFILVDEGSRNGTFLMIRGEVKLEPGDTIVIGRQLLRFEA